MKFATAHLKGLIKHLMKRIAIIPARGGSKRIKNKNIKEFNGKPIIYYIINTAKESNLFDKIHVSTDSFYIKSVVEKYNLEIDFMRPNELADDYTPIIPVINYVLDMYRKLSLSFDEIWLLMPCAPLIEVSDLQRASKIFSNQSIPLRPLMAAAEYPVPIEWAFNKNKKGILTPIFKNKLNIRSQDLAQSFYDSGTFMIFPNEFLNTKNSCKISDEYLCYELPKIKAIDIDNEGDWTLAEAIHFHKNF